MKMDKVTQMGLDAHRTFSKITGRDRHGGVVCRWRVEHRDHRVLREELSLWPQGTPVILEGTFGWGWLSDALQEGGFLAKVFTTLGGIAPAAAGWVTPNWSYLGRGRGVPAKRG